MSSQKIVVMKFGGASVATPENIRKIATLVQQKSRDMRVVVVASAMGNTTDHLLALAKRIHPNPPVREQDMLLSVGERVTISLLAMALHLIGTPAISFTGSQSGIITTSDHSNAKIIAVRPDRIAKVLEERKIAIVAGFQGMSLEKEITTLGRGGSDTTAVALGVALSAEYAMFIKDVSGIYTEDPKENAEAKFCDTLSYEEAMIICEKGKILHPRCIMLAAKNALPLHVLSYPELFPHMQERNGLGTWILPKEGVQNATLAYEAD